MKSMCRCCMPDKNINPLEGSILKGMLLFALPISISALLTMLFSCADTIVIGRFGHENAISAVGVSSSVLNLLVSGLTALAGGVTVTAGKYYGQGNDKKIRALLHTLPFTAFVLGTALSLCAICFSNRILTLLNCPAEIFHDAILYFRIYFLGVPLTAISCFLSSMLQARGNSYVPFFFQILASGINILLNLLFVIVFDWNVAGVAIATVLSQLWLAAAITIYMTKLSDELKLNLRELTVFQDTAHVLSIGIPSSLEGIVLNLSGTIISAVINRFDTAVIAGNTVAATIEGLMVLTFTGFANASAVYVSQNYGAGKTDRVWRTYRLTLATVFLLSELAGILTYLFSARLSALFTQDPAIIQSAQTRMFYMCLFFGLCGTMNVIGGCQRGLDDARTPLYIAVICSVVFRLTWIFTYAAWSGTIEAIYMSYPICWGLCTALNILAFRRLFRRQLKRGD